MQTETSPVKKILAIVGNVLLWAFLLFSILMTIMVFSAQNSPDGIPDVFGKSLLTVATDSMKPTFSAGDLIIMEKISQSQVPDLQEGDIITYRSPVDMDGDGRTGDINTHRILTHDAENELFITKGDNNPLSDDQGDYSHTVSYHAVVGRYSGTHIPGLGKVLAFLRTSLGFFLCVVLPLILFFLYELYNFISVIVTEKMNKKAAEAAAAAPQVDQEEIKRKAVEEYLRQQAEKEAAEKAEKEAAEKAAAEKTAAAPQLDEEEIKRKAVEEYLRQQAEKEEKAAAEKTQADPEPEKKSQD